MDVVHYVSNFLKCICTMSFGLWKKNSKGARVRDYTLCLSVHALCLKMHALCRLDLENFFKRRA